MKHSFKIISLLCLLTIFSCERSRNNMEISADKEVSTLKLNEEPAPAGNENIVIERKIIKEGEITFETADVKATRLLILNAVSEFKGYVSNDNVFDFTEKIEYKITIRVPAVNFDPLLNKISESAERLDSKSINALDVTEEYIDIEARLKTKKELENRYKELLKQAKTVDEMLSIEREIGTLRTEIESTEGRLKYLNDRVSLSTLNVTFYEKSASAFGFTTKFGHAVKNGWTNLLWFLIALTNLWPFLLIGLALAVSVIQYKRIRKRKNTV
jgi:hypothetical protein